jgi:hypothetical protein
MDRDAGPEQPADAAAAAFEALRREVALLNVAVAGLAAERRSAPDYSETLGEIAKGVSVAVGRLGKLVASPALAMSAGEMARQITAAGEEARRQDRSALHLAQEKFARAAGDLRAWTDSARLARMQRRRVVQTALATMLVGGLLGAWLPSAIAKAAPDQWAWPEKMAARIIQPERRAAVERLLVAAEGEDWQAIQRCLTPSGPTSLDQSHPPATRSQGRPKRVSRHAP